MWGDADRGVLVRDSGVPWMTWDWIVNQTAIADERVFGS